ncbi:MAG: U32 family peptidase C-terminal domain-containing protein, partial [Parasporobacterium sp.]|nr:U32 family peptidase C-terminal domain-containing protein [Parasporobacterium sp.]
CISYSGRCLLSAYMTGRSGNMGDCTHPCRWKYSLVEETRPGEYMPVVENDRGTYIFNSKDLCMIDHIPELVDAGISSFKVEGRMKSALYVASMCRTYRQAIDDYFTDPALYESRLGYYREEISKCTYREYTTAFFFGKPSEESQIYTDNTYIKEWVYLGQIGTETKNIEGRICWYLEQKNKFSVGDKVEIMRPGSDNIEAEVLHMYNEDLEPIESCPHARQMFYLDLGTELMEYDILRMNK